MPPAAADLQLITATQQSLDAARAARCGVPADFGGQGIGHHTHEDPCVPNRRRLGRGLLLRPCLARAIEPMLMVGGHDAYRTDNDGWTLRNGDGSRAARFEHTIVITDEGPRILTLP